jgi:hypothetical protein
VSDEHVVSPTCFHTNLSASGASVSVLAKIGGVDVTYGVHRPKYEMIQEWERLPDGWSFVEVAGVAVDSRDQVHVFNRGEHPSTALDKESRFLRAWGDGMFKSAHGIFIDKDDAIYLTDDVVRVVDTEATRQ